MEDIMVIYQIGDRCFRLHLVVLKEYERNKNDSGTYQPLRTKTLRYLETTGSDYPLTQRHITYDPNPKTRARSNLVREPLSRYEWHKGNAKITGRFLGNKQLQQGIFLRVLI